MSAKSAGDIEALVGTHIIFELANGAVDTGELRSFDRTTREVVIDTVGGELTAIHPYETRRQKRIQPDPGTSWYVDHD